jgi:hypothetical protein
MLDCERWTVTHSSGGAVVLALAFVPLAGLAFALGLVATSRAAVAVPVVVPVVADGDVLVADGDVLVADVADVADGDVLDDGSVSSGDGAVAGLDPAPVPAPDPGTAGALAAVEWLADGLVEGECDGDGDGEGDGDFDGEGEGEGEGVLDDGSARHTVSVFAVAAVAACVLPSTPKLRKLPLSKVTAATLPCAKRIRDRLSTLLVRVTVCSFVIRR